MADNAPTVGLAIIARDEAENLPHLLASIEGAFDQVVLLDTGSKDRTIAIFDEWAAEQSGTRCQTGTFEWCDDFAAARNAADAMLTTDWKSWADCDDVIVNADQLRTIATEAPDEAGVFFFRYDYAQEQVSGQCVCELWRERLVRREIGEWTGRVHECTDFGAAGVVQIPPERVQWRHRKPPGEPPSRNLDILQSWYADEPENPRVLAYLGAELAGRGRHEESIEHYMHYLAIQTEPDHHRMQTRRRLCASLYALERFAEIMPVAFAGLGEDPTWTDHYLSLAESSYGRGEWAKTIEWATEAQRRGKPTSVLIVNPLEYEQTPRVLSAGAHAALGNFDEACRIAEEALQLAPHPELLRSYHQWAAQRKSAHTANTWLAAADMLCRHDEQEKALALLEQTCPYYIVDHPSIVAMRSMLRERLAFVRSPGEYGAHYETGATKPEDMVSDARMAELCPQLPRAGWLLNGLRELDAERAAA